MADVLSRRERIGIAALAIVCVACYLATSYRVYAQYVGGGYDLGIFDQTVRAYSRFKAPIAPLKAPGFNILGDHFHPILALLAPVYWVWDNAGALVVAQALLTAASIPVVYRFTRRRAGIGFSWAVSAVYGLAWPIQTMIDVQFHEVAFAVPILALAIDALDRDEHKWLLLWSGALLLVREDMGTLVALLGVLAYLKQPPREGATSWRSRLVHRPSASAVALTLGGIAAYEVITGMIIPALAPSHQFAYWQFDAIGKNLPDALWGILIHPWHAVHVFVTPADKMRTLLYLLAPLAFLPLCSPYVVLALPLLAERFFNFREQLWIPHFQYNALPWLVLVLAFVDGATHLGVFRTNWKAVTARRLLIAFLVGAQVWLTGFVVAGQVRALRSNAVRLIENRRDATALSAQHAAALIPAHVCVLAEARIAPHLTNRDYVTLPNLDLAGWDFIVIDPALENVASRPASPLVVAAARANQWVTIFSEGPTVVLRSPTYAGPSAKCAPLGPGPAG
jgi:uncharacterized membrane protein